MADGVRSLLEKLDNPRNPHGNDDETLYRELFQTTRLIEQHRGFLFLNAWTMCNPRTPERILLPTGEEITPQQVFTELTSSRLSFGNVRQLMLLQALDYLQLINNPLFRGDREAYPSFLGSQKYEEFCAKYKPCS